MSAFDVIDIDGPDNDYANYVVIPEEGESGGGDSEFADITIRSGGKVTIVNAEGETMIFENGELSGTIEAYDIHLEVGDDESGDDYAFTYTVANSASFTFTPETDDLYVSVVSSDVYAASETDGARAVTISKDDGVSATGADVFSYLLSVSVNDGVCDMVSISGSVTGKVELAKTAEGVRGAGVDQENGRICVYSNTVNADTYAYLPGYASFMIMKASDTPGDVRIMGQSAGDGAYDVDIGVRNTECVHVWDDGVETVPATYTECGVMTFTCVKCGATDLREIPKLISAIKGDADGNGIVNIKDISALKVYIAGVAGDDEINVPNCDVDPDGIVNMRDIAALKALIAG